MSQIADGSPMAAAPSMQRKEVPLELTHDVHVGNTLIGLWEAHANTLTLLEAGNLAAIKMHVQLFYENVVAAGFQGGPLHDDVLCIIASFLQHIGHPCEEQQHVRTHAHACTHAVSGGVALNAFNVARSPVCPEAACEAASFDLDFCAGIQLLAQIGRQLVVACFIAELKEFILRHAIRTGSGQSQCITFKAGRYYMAAKGANHSSFFRDWMLDRHERKEPEFYSQLAKIDLHLPSVLGHHNPPGGSPYMQWTINLPSWRRRHLIGMRRRESPFV